MNKNVHTKRVTELQKWLSKSITLNLFMAHRIEGLYAHYERQVLEKTETLAVRPKTFSKQLRIYLTDAIDEGKVRIFYKNGPIVQGIDLNGL